jgi:hypothetical protein
MSVVEKRTGQANLRARRGPGDPVGGTETEACVVVMAPVLTVCRYLADIANIARGLPGVRSVHAGGENTLTLRYRGAAGQPPRLAPGRFCIDPQRQRVEWEIRASANYSGTLSIHGDCNISQLQSVLRIDRPSSSGVTREVHLDMLRRIAHAVQARLDQLGAPGPQNPTPRTTTRKLDAVLGAQGLVHESWTG